MPKLPNCILQNLVSNHHGHPVKKAARRGRLFLSHVFRQGDASLPELVPPVDAREEGHEPRLVVVVRLESALLHAEGVAYVVKLELLAVHVTGWSKKLVLGCAIPHPLGSGRWGEFTQPSVSLFDHPCTSAARAS